MENKKVTLLGGPADGKTVIIKADQSMILFEEMIEGPDLQLDRNFGQIKTRMHLYEPDGRYHGPG